MVSAGLQQENAWFGTVRATTLSGTTLNSTTTNATTVAATNVNATTVSGTTFHAGGNVILGAGSPYSQGIVVPMTARGIISGGMFVAASGGLAFAAPASTKCPIGIALATAASGASVNVLVRGIYPVVAEGTIVMGEGARMGAGAGLNCVLPYVAGSGCFYPTLDSAASGATVFIVL